MRFGALAWRNLAARPVRSLLTAIGIGLGVAIVAATLLAGNAASETVERAAQELLGNADLRIRAFRDSGFTPRTLITARLLPGVTAAAPVAERRITYYAGEDQVFLAVLTLGVDPAVEPRVREWRLTDGRFLDPERPSEALVGADWAARQGLVVGDEIRFDLPVEGTSPLRIVGLLAPSGLGALDRGAVIVLPRDTLSSAFEAGALEAVAPVRYVDLVVQPGAIDQVQRALDAELAEPFVVETVADAAAQLGEAQAGFAGLAFLFGLVALMVGGFLVFNTLAMTLDERTRELGLLRAAGTTSRQVLGLFLRQGAILGFAGSIAGVALGIALAAAIIGFLRSTRQVLIEGLPLSLPALVGAGLLGVIVAIAGAAVPAIQAAGLSPVEALRPSRRPGRTVWGRLRWLVAIEAVVAAAALAAYPLERGSPSAPSLLLPPLAILLGGALLSAFLLVPLSRILGRPFEWFFGAEGLLGRANLARDPARNGITVGALVMALAAVIALGAMAETARVGAERWVSSILPGGHAIRSGIPLPIDQFRATLEAVPETRHASPIVEFAALLDEPGERPTEVSLAGIDPTVFQDSGALEIVAGQRAAAFQALRDGGAVLVPQSFAAAHAIAVGDILPIGPPGESGELTVAGVVRYSLPGRGSAPALLISLADARERFGEHTASLWAMVPRPDVAPSLYRSVVADAARSLAAVAISADELSGELGQSLDRLVGLFDALAMIAVVIAALGIVNTLAMGVAERVHEIAVLRAHGMTVGQVQAMVVAEAAIMGLTGGIGAVAVGVGVGVALLRASAPGLEGGLALPWSFLVAVVLLGIGVATAAGIYPARLAARQSIVRRAFE